MSTNTEKEKNNQLPTVNNAQADLNVMPKSSNKIDGTISSPETRIKPEEHFNLKGIFRIGGQRNFAFPLRDRDYVLVCNTFWKQESLALCVTEEGVNALETFTITNDQDFLEKVRNKYLNVELLKIRKKAQQDVIGLLRLPLHQFFIAYRDATITNRLCDGQFPVISTNAWVPILDLSNGTKTGEIECLLALGTDKQIENIKCNRWKVCELTLPTTSTLLHDSLQPNSTHKTKKGEPLIKLDKTPNYKTVESESLGQNLKMNKTSDLLNMLQQSLATTPSSTVNCLPPTEHLTNRNSIMESFRVYLEIKNARDLPLNPSIKTKKNLKNSSASKGRHIRLPTGEEPNTYVTFQANECNGPMVKSHEGMVYSTNVTEKASNPIWGKSFYMSLSLDYLTNKNKRFILKIWRKSSRNLIHSRLLPSPMEDSIIGFTAIDLTAFSMNVPFISGLFNIVDFSGHINGQINVTARPMDDLQKLVDLVQQRRDIQVDYLLDSFESSLNINNMNLSRAIKRKFTELEEISQRLRTRLLDVTGNAEPERDMAEINDDQLDEFEHDLNTTACEDDSEVNNFSSHLNCLPTLPQSSSHTQ